MRTESEIEREAAEWLIRRDRSEASPQEERDAFEKWLAADARHRAAYLALEHSWRRSDGLKAWRPVDGTTDARVLKKLARQRSALRHWPVALAASMALATIAILTWISAGMMGPTTYTTGIGGYERVLLRDGSVLHLNTDTQVRVEFSNELREVRLLRGEAFFNVAHDARRPFEVLAGDAVLHAVGTAFTVRLREANHVEVVVTEGRVALRPKEFPRAAAPREPRELPPVISAGESAVKKPTGIVIRRIATAEVARRLAWRDGQLAFKGESLAEVVAEFNRYNLRRIEIADPALATLRVGGNFEATDVDSFVRALESSFEIRADDTDGVVRLSGR